MSLLVMRMPVAGTVSSFVLGMLSGLIGIIWIVVAAMLLYTITLLTGSFEIVKQSITVATAACYEDPAEGSHAAGPIFRTIFWHSLALAAFIRVIVMLQAYVVPWMVPVPPGG